jgi:hypothetical protein
MIARGGFERELFWLAVFGIAFGYLESAVVVYLRGLAYADGFSFPLKPIPPLILSAEVGREAATLAILAAVALAPGGAGFLKFARFLFCFGLWDAFYYVGLKILLDWPPSLFTWDVLFLIPVPWSAPVLAPVLVAAYFVVVGAYGVIRRGAVRTRPWQWGFAGAGAASILTTFLWNAGACAGGGRPGAYPWLLFGAGWAALAAVFAVALFQTESRRRTKMGFYLDKPA